MREKKKKPESERERKKSIGKGLLYGKNNTRGSSFLIAGVNLPETYARESCKRETFFLFLKHPSGITCLELFFFYCASVVLLLSCYYIVDTGIFIVEEYKVLKSILFGRNYNKYINFFFFFVKKFNREL